jgi:hypothetical protein
MKHLPLIAALVLVGLAGLLMGSRQPITAQAATESFKGQYIGATQEQFGNSLLNPNENYQNIRAYIRTGSINQNCLLTLGDSTFAMLGMVSFCATRQPVGLGKGVLVTVFFPQPPPPGLFLSVTLFQEGAAEYAPPVLCDVEGC